MHLTDWCMFLLANAIVIIAKTFHHFHEGHIVQRLSRHWCESLLVIKILVKFPTDSNLKGVGANLHLVIQSLARVINNNKIRAFF